MMSSLCRVDARFGCGVGRLPDEFVLLLVYEARDGHEEGDHDAEDQQHDLNGTAAHETSTGLRDAGEPQGLKPL